MKRSVSYASGQPERLQPEDVTTVPKFTQFVRQELGLSYPVGKGRREGWMKYCKNEMEVQGWSFRQLVDAVHYIKEERKSCKTLQGTLWYVDEAQRWVWRTVEEASFDDLHAKVADALAVEDDEGWRRKLALAQGKALEMVYSRWELERA